MIYIEQLPLSISEQQPIITRINTIHEQLYGPEKIALTKHGQHFILNALLNDSTIELMIDTGASITSITQAQFAQLGSGVKFKKQITVNTANGRTQAYMYTLDTFTIGKRQFKEFDILVMNENVQGRGLLGMNFLQHFAFEIEQNKAQLILKSK